MKRRYAAPAVKGLTRCGEYQVIGSGEIQEFTPLFT